MNNNNNLYNIYLWVFTSDCPTEESITNSVLLLENLKQNKGFYIATELARILEFDSNFNGIDWQIFTLKNDFNINKHPEFFKYSYFIHELNQNDYESNDLNIILKYTQDKETLSQIRSTLLESQKLYSEQYDELLSPNK